MSPQSHHPTWTAPRFFDLLSNLGPLRVISVCGPSVFEAICDFDGYEVQGGMINAITDAYHWHFQIARLGHLHSHDTIHKRSGRRVLFFELREDEHSDPFLRIYLYRPAQSEFSAEGESRFAVAHAELRDGATVEKEPPQ